MDDTDLQQRMCGTKKRFGDEGAADGAISHMRSKGKLKRTEQIDIYRCQFCQFYHFGHPTLRRHVTSSARETRRTV